MIAVIADDFTGAAEVGGVALRHGLKVVIETDVNGVRDVDIVIVATNTRSYDENKAASEVNRIIIQLKTLKPRLIFKKLDSVLRGNIVKELKAQMDALNVNKALVVAGNPSFGRLIRDGIYYINGVPLGDTYFSKDPEFPVESSIVKEIVEIDNIGITNLSVDDEMPDKGILFGDVTNIQELHRWALKIDDSMVSAGGAGFFDAILALDNNELKPLPNKANVLNAGEKALFVFGSAYPKEPEVIDRLTKAGVFFEYMPEEIYWNADYGQDVMDQWINDVISSIHKNGRVVVGVNCFNNSDETLALRIQNSLSDLVYHVMQKVELNDLLIEGGATTSDVLKKLNITKLYPFKEIDVGVIQMKTKEYENLCITTKPGSYLWPDNFSF